VAAQSEPWRLARARRVGAGGRARAATRAACVRDPEHCAAQRASAALTARL